MRMILRQAFFLILPATAFANMRAPVRIERAHTLVKSEQAGKIKVLAETLEFHCPESYQGKPNTEIFSVRACDTRARYKIAADGESVKLTFLFSGTGRVTWKHGDKIFTGEARVFKKDGSPRCSYCPDSIKNVLAAEQTLDLAKGENDIEISYRQGLAYDEHGHGYFSDGKWIQGFTYELWPIAEWQWGEKFALELKFSVAARSGFLGVGYKNDTMRCFIDENGKEREISLIHDKVTNDRRTTTAHIGLEKKPQQLRCHYAAD
jgi:hypothetical protein